MNSVMKYLPLQIAVILCLSVFDYFIDLPSLIRHALTTLESNPTLRLMLFFSLVAIIVCIVKYTKKSR